MPAPSFLDLLSYQFANSGNVAEQIIQPTHERELLTPRSFLKHLENILSLDIGGKKNYLHDCGVFFQIKILIFDYI